MREITQQRNRQCSRMDEKVLEEHGFGIDSKQNGLNVASQSMKAGLASFRYRSTIPSHSQAPFEIGSSRLMNISLQPVVQTNTNVQQQLFHHVPLTLSSGVHLRGVVQMLWEVVPPLFLYRPG
mmetsp:Transcript_11508/g.43182  ORF Transcript_11508/g.43182 Transcript_11508/m.43182 type:complete len:123 (+) Transcript_11508:227-595(+)